MVERLERAARREHTLQLAQLRRGDATLRREREGAEERVRAQPRRERKRAALAREQDAPRILGRALHRLSLVGSRLSAGEQAEDRRAERQGASYSFGHRAVTTHHVDPVSVTA